uniref:C2H2-type domain-containing protein n=1 Tax=Nothobranchius furzeri TaxID=105023 RepID=A0A8C6NWD5_NOTFU
MGKYTQKPFVCEFSEVAHLNRHMKVHTGHKPFACDLCEERFSEKTRLISHMKVHTGQKPFACEHVDAYWLFKKNEYE